jgi:Family of unknown function (DUF6502)
MARRGAPRTVRLAGAEKPRAYAQEVLRECATILVKTGHSPKELERTFRQVCRTLEEPFRPFDPRRVPFVTGLSHVVAHWYTDPAFLDRRNQPMPLPLRARGACLAQLIRRVLPRQNIEAVVEALVRTGALQRRGRLYAPTDRFIAYTDLSSAHVHRLTSLVGMLSTVQHNLSCADERSKLLERVSTNLYVPIRALPEIHRRLKREVTALLWKLDGYLRSWEVKPDSEPTTSLGVGGYAYEDPLITNTRTAAKAGRLPQRVKASPRARAPGIR